MEIGITATNGSRCAGETHRFRIGVAADAATEFRASAGDFGEALANALIDHVAAGRPGKPAQGLYLQVWCGSSRWRNVQSATSGSVIAVTHQVAGETATTDRLFALACNSAQMGRDIDVLSSGLAGAAIDSET